MLPPPEDLIVETWPPRQQGGQHVGAGPQGIRIIHTPSGMEAVCVSDRSQHRNRLVAMDMLLGGLTSPHYKG